MPHYADGTEAKVGDQVAGKLYNTDGVRAGTIISITPGVESCNAMVQFTELVKADRPDDTLGIPRMAVRSRELPIYRTVNGEAHGSAGDSFNAFVCADYCATNELTKIGP